MLSVPKFSATHAHRSRIAFVLSSEDICAGVVPSGYFAEASSLKLLTAEDIITSTPKRIEARIMSLFVFGVMFMSISYLDKYDLRLFHNANLRSVQVLKRLGSQPIDVVSMPRSPSGLSVMEWRQTRSAWWEHRAAHFYLQANPGARHWVVLSDGIEFPANRACVLLSWSLSG